MSRHGAKRSDVEDPHWAVDVDVYVDTEDANPPFWLETCLQVNSDNEIVFHNRGRHGFMINYYLHDQTDSDYVFLGDKKEAMWSARGRGCPPDGCGQWKDFKVHDVSKDQMMLTVRNLNEESTKFGYTLRVEDKHGNVRNLDPGGDNQNGFFLAYF